MMCVSARLLRHSAVSPEKLLRNNGVGTISKQKIPLFLLKEKIAREKIKKCRENFSVLSSS